MLKREKSVGFSSDDSDFSSDSENPFNEIMTKAKGPYAKQESMC